MIARRFQGDRATLPEFALWFIKRVGGIDDPDQEEEAARLLGAILERNLEIRTVTLVGAGFFGAAARHRNHILKLTTDETEPAAASQLLGKKLRHVVRFYEAAIIEDFRMLRHGGSRELPVGVILSEELDEVGLADDLGQRLDEIVSQTKGDFGIFDLDWENLTVDEARDAICVASQALEENLFAEGLEGSSIQEVALALEELRSHDVCIIDAHSKNVGYDRGYPPVHKIFDVGLASSPRDQVATMRGRARGR